MEPKRMKELTLIFKNCMAETVSLEHIGYFALDNIVQKLCRTHASSPGLVFFAKEFIIEIGREAGLSDIASIAQIEVTFNDDEVIAYRIPWGSKEFDNEYQRSKRNKHGDLFVAISKNLSLLNEVFPDEDVDSDDYATCGIKEDWPSVPYDLISTVQLWKDDTKGDD